MPDIFLSYSREDQATARWFAEGLAREGFSVWWDQALHPGEAFDQVTEQALEEAKAVVVLWSKASVNSRWVRAEATQASANGRLVPVMIEPCKRPIMFELTHTAELSHWRGDAGDAAWGSFVESLRRSIGKSGASADAAAATTPAVQSASPRRWIGWTAGVAAVLLVAAGVGGYLLHGRSSAPAATGEVSIAVLPFDDMSQGKDQGYFADGVAEEILNSLARIPDRKLRVIARNSSFVFRGATNLKEAGGKLDVDHLLEGSVRKNGDQLRVTAQLINVKTDAHLWSQTYDRPVADVFAIQQDIATQVAEALQVALGVGIGQQPGMTRDVEAYSLYLQAQSAAAIPTTESLLRAAGLLQQAVERDKSFAAAWLELSGLDYSIPFFVPGDAAEWQRKSDAAFEEFRRLRPDAPEIHYRLGQAALAAGRFKEALARLQEGQAAAGRQGLRVEPGLPTDFLASIGHVREAVRKLEQEKARDPLSPGVAIPLAMSYDAAGSQAAALAEIERAFQLGGPNQFRVCAFGVVIALGAHDRGQWVHWTKNMISVAPDATARAQAEHMLSVMDKPEQLLADARTALRDPAATPVGLLLAAQLFAYLGRPAEALQAMRVGKIGPTDAWGALFGDARRLPEFRELVREQHLPEAWREFGWGDYCKPTTGDDFECH